jgi:hypothetical protein
MRAFSVTRLVNSYRWRSRVAGIDGCAALRPLQHALRKLALLVSGVGRYRGSIAELMPLATGPMFILRLAVVFLFAISGFGITTQHLPRSIGCGHGSEVGDDRSQKATLHTSATAVA